MARKLSWLNFFRAGPTVAAAVCAAAPEHVIETAFVREVITERGLQSVRPDLAAWPWPIRVRSLGGFGIEIDGRLLVFKGKVAKKPLELLLFVIAASGADLYNTARLQDVVLLGGAQLNTLSGHDCLAPVP